MLSISACFGGVAIVLYKFHRCVPNSSVSRRSIGWTLHQIDVPTTGLHFADIGLFLNDLQELVDKGNTVLVIGHNPHVIKTDYIVDMGLEGGEAGGEILFASSPEEMSRQNTHTEDLLREIFSGKQGERVSGDPGIEPETALDCDDQPATDRGFGIVMVYLACNDLGGKL